MPCNAKDANYKDSKSNSYRSSMRKRKRMRNRNRKRKRRKISISSSKKEPLASGQFSTGF